MTGKSQPAFPLADYSTGMTLRDYFAGQAIIGYLANLGANGHHAGAYIDECATEAYNIADAMLAARESTT